MVVKRKSTPIVQLDPTPPEEDQALLLAENIVPSVLQDEETAAVCAQCGELLAWHEEACHMSSSPVPDKKPAPVAPRDASMPDLTPMPYAFEVGQVVQPEPSGQRARSFGGAKSKRGIPLWDFSTA